MTRIGMLPDGRPTLPIGELMIGERGNTMTRETIAPGFGVTLCTLVTFVDGAALGEVFVLAAGAGVLAGALAGNNVAQFEYAYHAARPAPPSSRIVPMLESCLRAISFSP